MNLTEQVKSKARQLGADLVGVAPVERFAGAPERMSPRGLLPGARSVVVAAIHHLDSAVELDGEPTPQCVHPYNTQCTAMNPKLDDISFLLARFLEDAGYRALPIAASNIWRYHAYKDLKVDFAPDLAHRYAAVAAGLGEIGYSGLVLTPEFGPRARFVSVVTDAELEPSPMYDGEPLCDKCMQCVENCPTDAFRKEVAGTCRVEIGARTFEFPRTNKWRCAWAENFALDLAHEIPAKVDEEVIARYIDKYGMRGGEEGCCLQFCMTPRRRYFDKAYCRPPRRRKERTPASPEQLLDGVRAVVTAAGCDVWVAATKQELAGHPRLNVENHLPGVESAISIGIRIPANCENSRAFRDALSRRLNHTAFDVAHYLDIAGYEAVCNTRISDNLVAMAMDISDSDVGFATILTTAPLPSTKQVRQCPPGALGSQEIRDICRHLGADLVGFFSDGRFEEFRGALAAADLPLKEAETVEDTNQYYGPYVPRIRRQPIGIKTLQDRLEGARSAIVLGLHLPHASLDTAKVTPAETVGPFAFARYEAQRLLGDMALDLTRRLQDAGARADFTFDLTGLGSTVHSSRGMLPDMRANRFAAVLAGLAYLGAHGCPITDEYGVRQLFVAVVTDLELPDDPLYAGPSLCETCDAACARACPTGAIEGGSVPLELQGRRLDLPRVNCFACDWAKRYCLSGEEGPKYCGLDVDQPLPSSPDARAVADAVSRANWGVQKRHANIVEECVRVCPARGRQD